MGGGNQAGSGWAEVVQMVPLLYITGKCHVHPALPVCVVSLQNTVTAKLGPADTHAINRVAHHLQAGLTFGHHNGLDTCIQAIVSWRDAEGLPLRGYLRNRIMLSFE